MKIGEVWECIKDNPFYMTWIDNGLVTITGFETIDEKKVICYSLNEKGNEKRRDFEGFFLEHFKEA